MSEEFSQDIQLVLTNSGDQYDPQSANFETNPTTNETEHRDELAPAPPPRVQQMLAVQNEARELFARKNRDYGDSFAQHGPIGVFMRITDKLNRLVSISKNGINLVSEESFRDTLIDLHNYAAMAVMLMDEKPV